MLEWGMGIICLLVNNCFNGSVRNAFNIEKIWTIGRVAVLFTLIVLLIYKKIIVTKFYLQSLLITVNKELLYSA